MKPIFKKGDWVFNDLVLKQIKSIDDGRIRCVTDGIFELSGYDLTDRTYPLTVDIKCISDTFKYYYDMLHRSGPRGLNFPDINRWLISKWVDACEYAMSVGEDAEQEVITAIYDEVKDFAAKALEAKNISVEGVKLFR
jgi:hypothetical protein